jgi:hypothetical protein
MNTNWDDPFASEDEEIWEPGDIAPAPVAVLAQESGDPTYRQSLAQAKMLQFPTPQCVAPWPSGLIFDLSIGLESTLDVLARYEIDTATYEQYMRIGSFRRELAEAMKRNQEEGITFSRRTAHIAEDCIPDMYSIIKDPLVAPAVRADIWKHMAKVGGLEPKASKDSGGSNAPQVNIQINL